MPEKTPHSPDFMPNENIDRAFYAQRLDGTLALHNSGLEAVDLEPDTPYIVSRYPNDLSPTLDVITTSINTGETLAPNKDNSSGDEPIISQRLRTVVRAGNETFAVVSLEGQRDPVSYELGPQQTIVTRVGGDANKGVDIVGIVSPDTELVVGRKFKPEYDETLADEHFGVKLLENGDIEVSAKGDSSRTELIKMRTEQIYVNSGEVYSEAEISDVATGGLKRFLSGKRSIKSFEKMEHPSLDQGSNPFNRGALTRSMVGAWNAECAQAEVALGITE